MPVTVDASANELRAERRIRPSGHSLLVSLPPQVVQQTGLSVGDDVFIGINGECLVLRRDGGGVSRLLRREGGSTLVTLPPDILRLVGFEEDDTVIVAVPIGGDVIELRPPESTDSSTDADGAH